MKRGATRLAATKLAAASLATLSLALIFGSAARAATFGELSGGGAPGQMAVPGGGFAAGPYSSGPVYCPAGCIMPAAPAQGYPWGAPNGARPPAMMPNHSGFPEGTPPASPGIGPEGPWLPPWQTNPRAYLPLGSYADTPNSRALIWTYGQVNATTDPFDAWGLSTPYMHIPWSTPLAGWMNAATWNWWRERSGALPSNW